MIFAEMEFTGAIHLYSQVKFGFQVNPTEEIAVKMMERKINYSAYSLSYPTFILSVLLWIKGKSPRPTP